MGQPRIVNEKTREAARLAKEVYEHSCVGGGLHIILDDWNIEDSHIRFCEEWIAKAEHQREVSPEQLSAERRCLESFKKLAYLERASALAIKERWI